MTWFLHEYDVCQLNCCHPNYHFYETHYQCLKYALQSMNIDYDWNSTFKIYLFEYRFEIEKNGLNIIAKL